MNKTILTETQENTKMMPTCRYCKHWYTDPRQVKIPGRGICLRTNCVQSDNTDQTRWTRSDEGSLAHAVTTVASSFSYTLTVSQLETEPDFGCNQFQVKDETE